MTSIEIKWGVFAIIEFIVSSKIFGNKYKTALDIGSGEGNHTKILRAAGLDVFQIDKYSDTAELKDDFMHHTFDQKFDVVFCSHVIEHQRNIGDFLDKIFDIMNEDGLLLISAPKHPAELLIEGHLNCFFSTYFIQHLVHAGFDLKNGKYLSGSFENAAIVPKADNFDQNERTACGYNWTDKHRERCFFNLENNYINQGLFFHNCVVFGNNENNELNINLPPDRKKIGIELNVPNLNIKVAL